MSFILAIKTFLRQIHYVSLDVVLGASLSHAVAARLPDGKQPVQWMMTMVLAISVFIIYTLDRLLDVRQRDSKRMLSSRHQFHADWVPQLMRVLVGLVGVTVVLLFWLPKAVLIFGIVMGVICAVYIAIVARLPMLHPVLTWKEPVVAVLYTAGIWGSAWVIKPTVSWLEVGLGFLFLLIALQNLLLFSVMEAYEYPEVAFSRATVWGLDRTDKLLRILTTVIVLAALGIVFFSTERFMQRMAMIECLMSVVLYFLRRYPEYFLRDSCYRWIGDGVFLLPGLIL